MLHLPAETAACRARTSSTLVAVQHDAAHGRRAARRETRARRSPPSGDGRARGARPARVHASVAYFSRDERLGQRRSPPSDQAARRERRARARARKPSASASAALVERRAPAEHGLERRHAARADRASLGNTRAQAVGRGAEHHGARAGGTPRPAAAGRCRRACGPSTSSSYEPVPREAEAPASAAGSEGCTGTISARRAERVEPAPGRVADPAVRRAAGRPRPSKSPRRADDAVGQLEVRPLVEDGAAAAWPA